MTDLQVIEELEKHSNVKMKLVALGELSEINRGSEWKYALDETGNVVGLRLDNVRVNYKNILFLLNSIRTLVIRNSPDLLAEARVWIKGLKNLTTFDLSYTRLPDYSWLKELKNLTSLDLERNGITDASWLKELKNLTNLNLGSNGITDVSWIKELKNLTTLDLGFNVITDASWIKELKNLTSLYLAGNEITDASWIKELKNLTSLDLGNNGITDVSWIKELKNLTDLDLSYTKLPDYSWLKELKNLTSLDLSVTKLPDYSWIKELKNLTTLNLRRNGITAASWIKELKNLTSLDLESNEITDASWLKELKNLTSLDLPVTKLPDYSWIKELKNLTSLDLGGNKIADASWVKELKKLTNLFLGDNDIVDASWVKELNYVSNINLSNNPLQQPPLHIANQGLEAIRSYFKQKEQQGTERLYEAKVLFVGEPGAGKTTLMKKLVDPGYPVPQPTEGSTLGIEIRQNWTFPHKPGPQGQFRAHLWDFGGQNIQYYIHQFFLTERSLYVLVTDNRKDNPNLDYWFNIIKLLGKESPVIVVENRKNITGLSSLDKKKYENRYRESFKELSFWDLNLSDKDNFKLAGISNRIQETLSSLPHIGEALPSGWVRVREELQGLQERNYIDLHEYQELCRKHSIIGETDQMVASGYFHDLGIILHFRKDTTLANIVFLNPQWLTKVMYIVLSDNKLREENAIFSKSWFMDRLTADYNAGERNNILLLTQKEEFDLCYRLPHCAEEKYLVPHLLPDIAPRQANEWKRVGCLNFRYTYAFMPIGIISRIIVRLNQWIEQDENCHPLVWKSGVILKRIESTALVVEERSSDGRQIIDICVCGPAYESKELLGIIRGEIETLHRSYKDIVAEQNVPCNCEVCKNSPMPTLFDAKRLMNHVKAGKKEIDCEKIDEAKGITAFRSVSIGKLLESVIDVRPQENEREMDKNIDPLSQIARDLHKLPDAVENLGKKVDTGMKDVRDSIEKNIGKKSFFQKITTWLTPFQRMGAIIVAAIAIVVAIKECRPSVGNQAPQSKTTSSKSEIIPQKDTVVKPSIDTQKKQNDSIGKDTGALGRREKK